MSIAIYGHAISALATDPSEKPLGSLSRIVRPMQCAMEKDQTVSKNGVRGFLPRNSVY
jgi:hypothetical protein